MPPEEILALMDKADERALVAVKGASAAIARAAESAAKAIGRGGRLIYIGAGTSGRLGVLDASECPPTFSAAPGQVIGIIAGGKRALTEAAEGAEDDENAGKRAISRVKANGNDVVIGITASGTTPYVLAALAEAERRGAETWLITCSPLSLNPSPTEGRGKKSGANASENPGARASYPSPCDGRGAGERVILLDTGPEVVSGSTRLAAGTATKLALNRITTAAFIMLGKVYGSLMVDVMPTNRKLIKRAVNIISGITGCDARTAGSFLKKSGMRPKTACVMIVKRVPRAEAERLLEAGGGFLRRALEENNRGPRR